VRLLEDIKKTILEKMYRNGYIGARHTAEDSLPKGFPSHRRGEVKDAVKELIKEGLLIPKPTSYGLQVSLNKYRIAEIERIIKT